jgi:hypothetical protein
MNINPQILKIAYGQYFCNIYELTNSQILTLHAKYLEDIYRDEDIAYFQDISENLLIWEPFEDVMPCKILENIKSLINDIQQLLLKTTEVTECNNIELASELAHGDLLGLAPDSELWQLDANGDQYYKEQYQDIFNIAYDHYMDIISQVVDKDVN